MLPLTFDLRKRRKMCKSAMKFLQKCCSSVLVNVPYKRKKVRNFFRHFCTEILLISAFFLPPKIGFCFPPKTVDNCGSWRLTLAVWYVAQIAKKTCRTQMKDLFFFFGDQHKIGEKDAFVGAMVLFFLGDHIKTGQEG